MKLSKVIGALLGILTAGALFPVITEAGLTMNHNETLLRDRS